MDNITDKKTPNKNTTIVKYPNVGCGCFSVSMGCVTLVMLFLFLCWFFFMGGCSLIGKKTREALSDNKIETSLTYPK